MVDVVHELALTTQGPTYPPSEVMDADGNFIVIGRLNKVGARGETVGQWGAAIVSADTPIPPFGHQAPYNILREFDPAELDPSLNAAVLHTLPVPLPCNNYPMLFAPEAYPQAHQVCRRSYPFHEAPIPDMDGVDCRRLTRPVTLGAWSRAKGEVAVTLSADRRSAEFAFQMSGLIPESLYTIMSLRARDLDPNSPTRPVPLGVPNVFVTDRSGDGSYRVDIPNPFPDPSHRTANRIISVVVLWMSSQISYGGAIGYFGLGGDIHAQLKLPTPSFLNLTTYL